MAADCLFCAIAAGDLPADKVYEDADALAIADINPQAPLHLLVMPKKHVADLAGLGADPAGSSALLHAIRAVAERQGLTDFRTVFNTGRGVGQTVFHVHAHILAGRPMSWPPG